MNKFEDRKAQYLNRKKYLIEKDSITRDEMGEITSFIAEDIKYDNPSNEGTPLKAEILTDIVKQIINDEIKNKLSLICSDEEKLSIDLRCIRINPEINTVEDLNLITEGMLGTIFNWSVLSGTGVTIKNNIPTINQTYLEQNVVLKVEATNKDQSQTKNISVKVLPKDVKVYDSIIMYPDLVNGQVRTLTYQLEPSSKVEVENDYPEYLSVTTSIANNVLTVRIVVETNLESGVIDVPLKVIVKDTNNLYITKDIRITVSIFYSSEVDD